MFEKLIAASKLEIQKGMYKLTYDAANQKVLVIDRRTGELNYIVSSEQDKMLYSTIIYFGLQNFKIEQVAAL